MDSEISGLVMIWLVEVDGYKPLVGIGCVNCIEVAIESAGQGLGCLSNILFATDGTGEGVYYIASLTVKRRRVVC